MSAIYRLNASEIDAQFLEDIKTKFSGKDIEIVISELDETTYLLRSPSNKNKLINALENIKKRQGLIEINLHNFMENE